MTLEEIRAMLAWCIVINGAFLVVWGTIIMLARDFVCDIHAKMFKIPKETIVVIHYCGMAMFKIAIILFFLAPYLALRIFV